MRRALLGSTLTVPDGMPLVWVVNRLGERLADRVYGPGLMERYCARCAEAGHRVWLYGRRDAAALGELEDALRRRFPGIELVGSYAPPFRPLTPAEEDEVAARIDADRPDVLWVGTGVPRQEKWMAHMRPRLEVPVMCAVGAAFDFLAGRVPQAPEMDAATGFEWLFRLTREPRRRAALPLLQPRFAWAAARQIRREARRTAGRGWSAPGPARG